eukprot:89711_1
MMFRPLMGYFKRVSTHSVRSAWHVHRAHFSVRALILADHDGAVLSDPTLSAVTAAKELGGDVCVLVAGKGCGAAAKQASSTDGVSRVFLADHASQEHSLAENVTPVLEKLQKDNGFSHILAPHTSSGKNIIPRLGGVLDVQPVADVTVIKSADTFERPVYAGNAFATVRSSDSPKLLTVRPTSFEKAASEGGQAEIESVDVPETNSDLSKWVSDDVETSDRPSLTSARVVVSGGRGMKNGENFEMLNELADKLGGAVGASRAAVDAGYVGNDHQVGQTGKVVAPDLYLAVGISGAIQHLAGMKDSKVIVAINKDAEAPIFQVADYGLVADLFKAVPEMNKIIEAK